MNRPSNPQFSIHGGEDDEILEEAAKEDKKEIENKGKKQRAYILQ